MDLQTIRQHINQIDASLVELLEQRMKLVDQVVFYKQANKMPILDLQREEKILLTIQNTVQNPAYTETICNTFKDIMSHSKTYQVNKLSSNKDEQKKENNQLQNYPDLR